jgi:hypothetical protein
MCAPPTGRAPGEDHQTTEGEGVSDDFEKGDHVTWNSHGSKAEGTVTRKITEETEAAGRTVEASSDDPQYEVESDRSGKTAVHRPSALDKK